MPKYACLMLRCQLSNWGELMEFIDPADIHKEEGIEDEPHITVLYGLHPEVLEKDVYFELQKALTGPVTVSITGISHFANGEFDVVKFDIDSPDLHRINKALQVLPFTNQYPVYEPHMTLSYVNPGCGPKYDIKFEEPMTVELDTFKLSFAGEKPNYVEFEVSDVLDIPDLRTFLSMKISKGGTTAGVV